MPNNTLLESIETGKHLKGCLEEIRTELLKNKKCITVLDDDPTGTQTIYDVPVITQWSEEVIEEELLKSPIFFILTNSRSLQAKEAYALGELIGERLKKLSKKHVKDLIVISRGDSTLRGHYPNEVNALAKGLEWAGSKHVLIPAFFEGGRYTYNNIHYVQEGDEFVPAAETPFAKDNTFGYSNSNLKKWIQEKTSGVVKPDSITSISISKFRNEPVANITAILEQPDISHVIANATSYYDLQTMALASLKYNKPLLFRTAASFINAISGIATRPCLTKDEILGIEKKGGGLIVIGSYVPKSTAQLNHLKKSHLAFFLELDAAKVVKIGNFQKEVKDMANIIDSNIKKGKDVVLFTSRTLIKGTTKSESLEIVNKVSDALIQIVKQLSEHPKYLLAKGGITSSDIATKGLNVERAMVLGQAIKGVPVWQLGAEAKFPNMPYIVFPGNVGDTTALYTLIKQLE